MTFNQKNNNKKFATCNYMNCVQWKLKKCSDHQAAVYKRNIFFKPGFMEVYVRQPGTGTWPEAWNITLTGCVGLAEDDTAVCMVVVTKRMKRPYHQRSQPMDGWNPASLNSPPGSVWSWLCHWIMQDVSPATANTKLKYKNYSLYILITKRFCILLLSPGTVRN